MSYNKTRYNNLRTIGGFTAKEAKKLASRSDSNVKNAIQDKLLNRIESGEKLTTKAKYQALRFFDVASKVANKAKSYGVQNFYNMLLQHSTPKVFEYAHERLQGIPMLSAFAHGRYQKKQYLYEVEYYVDTGFTSSKKFVVVPSNKKLTRQEIHEFIVDRVFPDHEKDYESVPLEETIKVVRGYYIDKNEQTKILTKREEELNGRKKGTHNK